MSRTGIFNGLLRRRRLTMGDCLRRATGGSEVTDAKDWTIAQYRSIKYIAHKRICWLQSEERKLKFWNIIKKREYKTRIEFLRQVLKFLENECNHLEFS